MNSVRSILSAKAMPKEFWAKAVNWAIHVLNRSPTLVVKDVTPEEAWGDLKPYVSHFCVFRCVAYVYVPDEKRKKLDDKSVKCVLLGTSEEFKAYRLYDPKKQRIIINRDIVCIENEKWNWESNEKTGEQNILEWEDNAEHANDGAVTDLPQTGNNS